MSVHHPVDGSRRVEFKYDYLGRRFEKIVTAWDETLSGGDGDWKSTPESKTRYLYDGWRVVAELDGLNNNAVLRRYSWGLDLSRSLDGAGGIGGLLAVEQVTGSDAGSYVYTYDHFGNVGQLVEWADLGGLIGNDWDASRLAAKYEYDPYGNITGPDSDSDGVADAYDVDSYASTNPMRFSTKAWDNETGFGYWSYRYYSPELGRWLNRDPIEEEGGSNLYQYSRNSTPLTYDNLGHEPISIGTGAVIGGIVACAAKTFACRGDAKDAATDCKRACTKKQRCENNAPAYARCAICCEKKEKADLRNCNITCGLNTEDGDHDNCLDEF